MAHTRPELADLRDDALADIERLLGADARLKMGNLSVLAYIVAGGVDGLHGRLDWIAKQILDDTCDGDILERRAALRKIFKKPAVAAVGKLAVTGAIGSDIDVGTQYVRRDGILYTVTAPLSMVQTSALVEVKAEVVGVIGNAAAGTALKAVLPVPGVDSDAVVDVAGISGGTEQELIEALRRRYLKRLAEPIRGGATGDYETWALEVPGVTRAWEAPLEMGAGTVSLRFVRDDDDNPIPDEQAVATVNAYLQGKRPVTATLYTLPPIAVPLDFAIRLTPDTSAVRAAVRSELNDLIKRSSFPGGTLLLTHISEAISIAPGEEDHELESPTANVTHAVGHMAVMGEITWL